MKLIVEAQSIDNLAQYNVDGLIFSYSDFATISTQNYSIDEIETIVRFCQENKILSILKIDKIIEEIEVNKLNQFLEEMLLLNIDFYIFTDMSVLNFFANKDLTTKLIYSAKTLNCSYEDCLFYKQYNIKVMLSNELTLEDIQKNCELDNIVIDGYGYSKIFYSKRRLLTLFAENYQIDKNLKNMQLFIKEETREDKNPIFENKHGTFVFTHHKYLFYKEIQTLKNLFMFKIESLFIEEQQLFKIINIYRHALKFGINEVDYQKLIAIDNNISQSFLYKKPLILKGKTNEEN